MVDTEISIVSNQKKLYYFIIMVVRVFNQLLRFYVKIFRPFLVMYVILGISS